MKVELPRSQAPTSTTKWVLVVDTDSPALPTFFREMAGFVAGCWGRPGETGTVGYKNARLFHRELSPDGYEGPDAMYFGPLAKMFDMRPDDLGHLWPCSYWPTPGATEKEPPRGNMSLALFLKEEPDPTVCRLIASRSVRFAEKPISEREVIVIKPFTVTGVRLLSEQTITVEVDNWIVPV